MARPYVNQNLPVRLQSGRYRILFAYVAPSIGNDHAFESRYWLDVAQRYVTHDLLTVNSHPCAKFS